MNCRARVPVTASHDGDTSPNERFPKVHPCEHGLTDYASGVPAVALSGVPVPAIPASSLV